MMMTDTALTRQTTTAEVLTLMTTGAAQDIMAAFRGVRAC